MKTKTVTIHNWDGSKQKVNVPAHARFIEITPYSGGIYAHTKKPKLHKGWFTYKSEGRIVGVCPKENRPCEDGIEQSILLKIEEV